MKITDTRRYEMLVRVRDFGAAHADLFPSGSLARQMFGVVKQAVATLSERAATQLSSRGASYGASIAKADAHATLRSGIEAIHRTARALSIDTPGFNGKFRLPYGNGEQSLIVTARAYVRDAQPLASVFVTHGMPKTFVDDLSAAIRAFETAIHDHSAGRHADVAAQSSFDEAMQDAMTAVSKLDAVVANRLHDDAATYAVWQRLRRIGRTTRARNGAPDTPTPPPASAPPIIGAPAST